MKANSMVVLAMGLASSAAWAQSGYSAPIPATAPPAVQAPAEGMQRDSGMSEGAQPGAMDASGAQSSGAPAQDAGQAGSSGQLITPSIVQSRPAARTSSAPVQPQSEGEVTYLCGGIGDEETNYMKQAARDYDVMMTFAAQSGSYLANVAVTIADARGNTVLSTTCDAPLMLVDLPRAGAYRIQADVNGHQINRRVSVGASGQANRVVFAWPRSATGAGAVAGTTPAAERINSSGENTMRGASGRSSVRPMDAPGRNEMPRRPAGSGATGSSGSSEGNGMSGAGNGASEQGSNGNAGSSNGMRYDSPTRGVR